MKKLNKTIIVFLIVMILLSFINLLNIKIDGELLKLSGISVIVGVIAYFVTRKTNKAKYEGFNIKTIFKDFKNHPRAIVFAILPFITCILSTVIANNIALGLFLKSLNIVLILNPSYLVLFVFLVTK